jgi:hypothetical protein
MYLKRDGETQQGIDVSRKYASKNYEYKRHHNDKNGIEYLIGLANTTCFDNHDFGDIPKGTVFDTEFTNLIIPIIYK